MLIENMDSTQWAWNFLKGITSSCVSTFIAYYPLVNTVEKRSLTLLVSMVHFVHHTLTGVDDHPIALTSYNPYEA